MTTQEVADKFYELAQANEMDKIQDDLYSDDAESVEPPSSPMYKDVKGKAAIKEKGAQFQSMIEEMYGGWTSKPVVGGNFFSVGMGMDVKMKGMDRMNMDEVCVYQVKDGKIVKEEFFY